MRSGKELCSMLITRGIKTLSEEEEEVVVDFLDDLGVDVELDESPKQLCMKLLETVMINDLGRKVPISAYANSVLEEQRKKEEAKEVTRKIREEARKRRNIEIHLESKEKLLPGCIPDEGNIFQKTLYDFVVNPEVGLNRLSNQDLQYSAEVSVQQELYNQIFLSSKNPILEITTSKGDKGYAKITSTHAGAANIIYISPLVEALLNVKEKSSGTVRLCIDIPFVKKIDFSYYGSQAELEKILPDLIVRLPEVIHAFSYLSLGMLLRTDINDQEVIVRVDKLEDSQNGPIFVGIVPVGQSYADLPFDIVADM